MLDERYGRHAAIQGWDQARLAAATVVIAGMGALGNEVSHLLAMAGVGRLVCCDPDRVARSNLSRTVLFRDDDIGRPKVDVAAAALAHLTPDCVVDARARPLAHAIGLAELRDAELVIGCLDSRRARSQLAERCLLVGAPCLDGGTHPWGGEVRPYFDPKGPCYVCGLTAAERARNDDAQSCAPPLEAPEGAAAPSSALVGSWMAFVAVRRLMGLPVADGIIRIEGDRGKAGPVVITRDPDCPLHRTLEDVRPIDVRHTDTVAALLQALPAGAAPLAWAAYQRQLTCRHCGFREARYGIPAMVACPRCGQQTMPRTTLELADAPQELTLDALGIPPREILLIRIDEETQAIELRG